MDPKKPLKVKMVVSRKNLEMSRKKLEPLINPTESLSEMAATRPMAPTEPMAGTQPKMLRLPKALHTKLVIEAGERTVKTGKRVSVNEVIVSILENWFGPLSGKRG